MQFAPEVYQQDPNWVPPDPQHVLDLIRDGGPFAAHCRVQSFLAERNGDVWLPDVGLPGFAFGPARAEPETLGSRCTPTFIMRVLANYEFWGSTSHELAITFGLVDRDRLSSPSPSARHVAWSRAEAHPRDERPARRAT